MRYTDYINVNGKRYTSIGTLYPSKSEANKRAVVFRKQGLNAVVRPVGTAHGIRYSIFARKKL